MRMSTKEKLEQAFKLKLEAEGDFLQQVNVGVKSSEEPKWKKVRTRFSQDGVGRKKWAEVHKTNIVAEAVSDCRDFLRPRAEFRVMENAPKQAAGSAGYFVAERVGDSAGSVEEWHQNTIDAAEYFLRETESGEIWLMTDVKCGPEHYKEGDQLKVVGGPFEAEHMDTKATFVVTANMKCSVGEVDVEQVAVAPRLPPGRVKMFDTPTPKLRENKITMFKVEDAAGKACYLRATPEICKNHLRPVVGPVWVRARGPAVVIKKSSSSKSAIFSTPGMEKCVKTSNKDMLGKRFQVLTLAKDYLARFGAATRVGAGECEQKVSSALMRAVLDPGQQEEGTCEIATVHPGDFPSNAEQKRLVTSLGNSRITVAQGPPGTGKSTTIYHIVNALGQEYDGSSAALVTCVTNTAINSIVEKLKECEGKGVFSLVLGNKDRVGTDAAMFLLDEKAKRDDVILITEVLRSKLEGEYTRPKVAAMLDEDSLSEKFVPKKEVQDELQKLWKRVESKVEADLLEFDGPELETRLGRKSKLSMDDLVRRADRLCQWARASARKRIVSKTTCFLFTIASGYRMQQLTNEFQDYMPETMLAILDEAGATAESYAPMLLETGVKNLVLLGDTMQLRPLVKGEPPEEAQVDRSLMERCCHAGAAQLMLKEQYRMPEVICNVVSKLFYKNKLRTGAQKKNKTTLGAEVATNKKTKTEKILCWVDVKRGAPGFCASCRETTEYKVGTSWCSAEQAVVALMWAMVREASEPSASIFIICMYKPQVRLLQRVADKLSLFSETKQTSGVTPKVRILSVDACQGSEADHVVLVTTRSNPHNSIGFVKNPNRANVAISRSKKTLTVIGDRKCMSAGSKEIWGEVAKKCEVIDSKKQGTTVGGIDFDTHVAIKVDASELAEAVENELKRMGGTDSKAAGNAGGGKWAGKAGGKHAGTKGVGKACGKGAEKAGAKHSGSNGAGKAGGKGAGKAGAKPKDAGTKGGGKGSGKAGGKDAGKAGAGEGAGRAGGKGSGKAGGKGSGKAAGKAGGNGAKKKKTRQI
eukprot:g14473.t1